MQVCRRKRDEIGHPRSDDPKWFTSEWLVKNIEGVGAGREENDRITYNIFEMLSTLTNDYLGKSIDYTLASMITGTWTAFQTMAGDLWTVSLNLHPVSLALMGGNEKWIGQKAGAIPPKEATPMNAESEDTQQRRQDKGRTLRLTDLHEFTDGTFDLRSKMGDFLRNHFDFTSLATIRRAYSLAFSDKWKGNDRIVVESIGIALADNALDGLSELRNLIVHRAGIVDRSTRAHLKA